MLPAFPALPAFAAADPVAASLARGRAIMAHTRAEQEHAQRTLYAAEVGEDEGKAGLLRESRAGGKGGADVEVDEGAGVRTDVHHVYDDKDAALQAALQVLLAHHDTGLVLPAEKRVGQGTEVEEPSEGTGVVEETRSIVSTGTGTSAGSGGGSVDKLRRRRLARFGA